jgi:hypothetical protein
VPAVIFGRIKYQYISWLALICRVYAIALKGHNNLMSGITRRDRIIMSVTPPISHIFKRNVVQLGCESRYLDEAFFFAKPTKEVLFKGRTEPPDGVNE